MCERERSNILKSLSTEFQLYFRQVSESPTHPFSFSGYLILPTKLSGPQQTSYPIHLGHY